jgi:hypothetical protein
LVRALNTGLSEARAGVIARMDADDICGLERLRKQFDALALHPDIDLVSCLVEPVSDTAMTAGMRTYLSWVNACVSAVQISRGLLVESPLPHPSVMFRANPVARLGGYREYDGPEDYDLWLRMDREGMQMMKVEECLLQWRFHGGNLTRCDRRYSRGAFLERKIEHVLDLAIRGKLFYGNRRLRICGTGLAGRRLNRRFRKHGIGIDSFVDIDPSRAGKTCQEIPVVSPDAVGRMDSDCFYISTMQRWDSWEDVRRLFVAKNKTEWIDFVII